MAQTPLLVLHVAICIFRARDTGQAMEGNKYRRPNDASPPPSPLLLPLLLLRLLTTAAAAAVVVVATAPTAAEKGS